MNLQPDCYPCLARNALDVVRLATKDTALQHKILQHVMNRMGDIHPSAPPPLTAQFIQETVIRFTGCTDPYAEIKEEYNKIAMDLYPELAALKNNAGGPEERFEAGVRLAVAGNIIDFGVGSDLGMDQLKATIDHAMATRVKGSIADLKQAADKARKILWIGDNAGEIVFDKLLLEEMDCSKVIYVVRGGPVQNDATMADAEVTGLTEMVTVIESGAAIPGTFLADCSEELKAAHWAADLIISKGQGNLETLDYPSVCTFFLLKAKCPVVAAYGGWDLGDVVVAGPRKPTPKKNFTR